METKKIDWIDTVRVFTMILVVLGHCNYYNIETPYGGIHYGNIDLLSYKILGVVTGFIYSFHMPLFMAVSGACFYFSMKRRPSFGSICKSKATRLLIPFILVTTFLSVPLKYASGYYDNSEFAIKDIFLGQYLLLGNSHLWYVVSLFYIFVVFTILEKYVVKKNLIYWSVLILLSWIGNKIGSHYYELFGLTGMMKHLFYFSIGYHSILYVDKKQLSVIQVLFSWVGMFVVWYLSSSLLKTCRIPIGTIIALWGCCNMVFSCKLLTLTSIVNNSLYKYCSRNSYELYLYSDPFNYVLIASFAFVAYNFVFGSELGIVLAFLIRFVFTILMSSLLILIFKKYSK